MSKYVKLYYRTGYDDIESALNSLARYYTEDVPMPVLRSHYVLVPRVPEVADVFANELAGRGLRSLARRVHYGREWG